MDFFSVWEILSSSRLAKKTEFKFKVAILRTSDCVAISSSQS